jgi:hypothetical protein
VLEPLSMESGVFVSRVDSSVHIPMSHFRSRREPGYINLFFFKVPSATLPSANLISFEIAVPVE